MQSVFCNQNPGSAHVIGKAAHLSGFTHGVYFQEHGGLSLYGLRDERIENAAPLAMRDKGEYIPRYAFKDFDLSWAE